MISYKSIYLSSLALISLASCGTSKRMFHATAVINPITAPLNSRKKVPLSQIELRRWSHLDLEKDTIPGMSVDRAYEELLKGKKNIPVVVAILDTGVDINHEDLKSVIWTNKKEIPDNGIDDDKNGYIDDIHGWNFLGQITKENSEFERILANKDLVDAATFQRAKAENDKKVENAVIEKKRLEELLVAISNADASLQKYFGKTAYSVQEIIAINSEEEDIKKTKAIFQRANALGKTLSEYESTIQLELNGHNSIIKGDNLKTNYRKVVGDNPDVISDTKYGDNNVAGIFPNRGQSKHGTEVAGIVAAVRNNEKGADGIANNVQIQVIRAVPWGSEYDKDIALGIRYAADNGAKIITASFGKAYSPHKQWVHDAIKYAESKDALIVNSAGNDAKDIDVETIYPNDSEDNKTEFVDNLITVGALNYAYSNKLMAYFSNYGKLNVDVFAPGMQIYTTSPKNKYNFSSGTSVAAPNVAGVAALIRSYYPKLTASQVKHILMDSGVAIPHNVVVGIDPKDIRPFASLSKSGKIVNAYNALLMAEKISKKK